jgi:hypothetical protein
MNKLNTAALGGMELHLDDFEFLHSANKEMTNAFTDVFGRHTRTFGTTVVLNTISWGDGFYLGEEEVFGVDAGALSIPIGQTAYIALAQSFIGLGDEPNKAGNPIRTYIRRGATIRFSANPTTEPDFLVLLSNSHQLAQAPRYLVDPWLNISLVPQYSVEQTVRARREGTGIVRLSGIIRKESGGNVNISATPLPANMRPPYNMAFFVFAAAPVPVWINVQTNGHIQLNIETNITYDDPTGLLIHLNGITYNV